MSNPIELWQTTADAFDARFKAIDKGQWAASTPCSEWTVHELVSHATGVQVSMGGALGGQAAEGADWKAAKAAMEQALTAPGALDGTVDHPLFGTMPKAMIIGIATTDLLLHTWDLARAIGADETLPTAPAEVALAALQGMPAEFIRAPGRFASAVEVADSADLQAKLLAFSGRKA